MKIAVVLDYHSPCFNQRLSEIDHFLNSHLMEALTRSTIEIWLFGNQKTVLYLPPLDFSVQCVRWLPVSRPLIAENAIDLLARQQVHAKMDTIIFYDDPDSNELATRLAYREKGSSVTSVYALKIKDGHCQAEKSCYNHNMIARFSLEKTPYCISIATQPADQKNSIEYLGEQHVFLETNEKNTDWLISIEEQKKESVNLLTDSDLVLAVGMGLGGPERLETIRKKIENTPIALGCSRPVAMNAWCALEKLIGISGQNIAPKICIAAGVSGASAFTLGIKKSQCIIAINTDPQASIFSQADWAVEGDMHTILPELIDCIKSG